MNANPNNFPPQFRRWPPQGMPNPRWPASV